MAIHIGRREFVAALGGTAAASTADHQTGMLLSWPLSDKA